jgi:hypothetical protein
VQWGIGLAIDALMAFGLARADAFRAALALFGVAAAVSFAWYRVRREANA